MTAFYKIATLNKAANGDLLTPEEELTLKECANDYRPRFLLGNGFKISMAQIMEAFEIIYEDVKWMTGSRRQRAIRLLKATGAAGYRHEDLPVPIEHPTDEGRADRMEVPVGNDEIREAG